jgi:hypothetical protein
MIPVQLQGWTCCCQDMSAGELPRVPFQFRRAVCWACSVIPTTSCWNRRHGDKDESSRYKMHTNMMDCVVPCDIVVWCLLGWVLILQCLPGWVPNTAASPSLTEKNEDGEFMVHGQDGQGPWSRWATSTRSPAPPARSARTAVPSTEHPAARVQVVVTSWHSVVERASFGLTRVRSWPIIYL